MTKERRKKDYINHDDNVMGYTKKTEVIKKFLNRKREKAKQV
jgi:hypothetical protein